MAADRESVMAASNWISGKTAIAGIGATDFSKKSGRSELRLAVEATKAALEDAGLAPTDVDGLVTFNMDSSMETEVARNLGIPELKFHAQSSYGGGGACTPVQYAALAVASGIAKVVVFYRAFNERSEVRFGTGMVLPPNPFPGSEELQFGRNTTFGLATGAAFIGMFARRYMHEYGATSEDFGRVSVVCRRNASTNPKAWFYGRPITLQDHQASPYIAEPLRLLDCCQESDGGVAIVITSTERARDLRQKPAIIRGTAQGSSAGQEQMTSYYRPSISHLPEMALVGRQLYEQAGLGPRDIQTAILYDHFTPFVLFQLEALGFCPRGEARNFIADGGIEFNGSTPINPHGGQLGEAYIHGVNGIAEGVRQIRGTAANQVPAVEHVLITAGTGVPTGGLILGV
jgi:acetyl-CoA acetyltransferase